MKNGYTKRTTKQELNLRVLMLNSEHLNYIYQKALDELGERAKQIGPLDFTRNPAVRYTQRLCNAHDTRPGITNLQPEMSELIGDFSSQLLKDKYQALKMAPMPTNLSRASSGAEWYLPLCHYAGVYVGWNYRAQKPFMQVITPDNLELHYDNNSGDDEPILIKHNLRRSVKGQILDVYDVYDLRDLEKPSFKVLWGEKDVTLEALGNTYEGMSQWPVGWIDAQQKPICPISIYGKPQNLNRGLEIVEGTLRVAVGLSWWWAGYRDACYKGRNVRGLSPVGMDSSLETRSQGISTGPEDVMSWRDDNQDLKGEHWQWDAPFDALNMLEGLDKYESNLLMQMGVPVPLNQTGGEPLAFEMAATEIAAMKHYDDLRSGDAKTLRLLAIRINAELEKSYPEEGYGIEYSEEMKTLLGGNENGGRESTDAGRAETTDKKPDDTTKQ